MLLLDDGLRWKRKPSLQFRHCNFLGTERMGIDRPYYFTNLKAGKGVEEIVDFIVTTGRMAG